MPQIQVPGDSAHHNPNLDLSPDLRDLNKTLRDNLNVRTTADVYQKLAGHSDSSLPVMQGLGDAFSGMAKGYQGLGDMQTLMMKQMQEHLQGGQTGGGAEEMMKWMMLYKMMRELNQEESPKTDEDAPSWRDLLAEQEKRHAAVEEAKEKASQDPMNDQLQGAFYGMMGQLLQNQLTPQHPADAIKNAKDMVDTVSQWTGGGQQSFQERRLEKLDNMAMQKMQMEYQDKQEDRKARQTALKEDYPAIANGVVNGLAQLMQGFGFSPMSGGPGMVSPEAMAAAQAQRATA